MWNLIGQLLYCTSLVRAYHFLEQLEQDFPYWKRLHGFWRTLPNFNPYTASSEPGQDLASEALALLQTKGQNADNEAEEEDDEHDGSTQQVNRDIQVCINSFPCYTSMY